MDEEFEISYGNDDGYVGGGKHTFYIDAGDIEDDMSDEEIDALADSEAYEDFLNNNLHIYIDHDTRDRFREWAKAVIARNAEEA